MAQETFRGEPKCKSANPGLPQAEGGGGGRDAADGKGLRRRPQRRLVRRLEEVAEAVGGGYCRLQMPLRLALGVRGTVAPVRGPERVLSVRRPIEKRTGPPTTPPPFCTTPSHRPRGVLWGWRADCPEDVARSWVTHCAPPRRRPSVHTPGGRRFVDGGPDSRSGGVRSCDLRAGPERPRGPTAVEGRSG